MNSVGHNFVNMPRKHDWAGLLKELKSHLGARGEQVKQVIPYVAQGAEAYITSGASLIRTMSQPAKTDLIKALSQMPAMGGRSTSALSMAYGKRRNYRAKRPSKRSNKGRKRSRRRGSKKGSSSNLLSTIHKALKGTMAY